ncbi:LD-carboxypeptidase [Limnobacter humi]|uniref:LD-carboxypeptidase n=1 Tax=Limnobacter humi TaxID=1778671 RepID=A0ABT1WEM6_9BURK|nr:LD-carboxypeptidase [Limnobacter humi]MCQ8895968.1 LD-carboxypeptidase [Limnobacter humi]
MNKVWVFSPSGAIIDTEAYQRGLDALRVVGFDVSESPEACLREQRFAGSDEQRLQAIVDAANASGAQLLMATRGGYGLTRLLPGLPWATLAEQLRSHGHVLCGHSDVTALQLGLMAQSAIPLQLLHGPMVCFDFGGAEGIHPTTLRHFQTAVHDGRVEIDWECQRVNPLVQGDQLEVIGPVWGGNLAMLCSVLGTPWLPAITGGILVLEDVNEPVYRIERMLLQLQQAGILGQQQAVLVGQCSEPAPSLHDGGYALPDAIACVQAALDRESRSNNTKRVPILTDFPFGHTTPKACFFQGVEGKLTVDASRGIACRLTQNL